ncbi:MAG: type II toxin-antitoxin system RelE/ParE family toxin [Hyphomicrobiales bacterium]
MRVEFSPGAENDLREIALFIAIENPERAITFTLELQAAAKGIGDNPRRFKQIGTRGDEPVRRRIYNGYVILFRHNDDRVAILRIVHGAAVTGSFIEDL